MNMWLVGTGYWGTRLARVLHESGVQCSTIDIRNGQTLQDITTGDAVLLATPLWQHYQQVMLLLSRGHDVYVEKPATETAVEAGQIRNTVQPGQLFMVGHLFQHHPQIKTIKALIVQGTIGSLIHVTSHRLNWGIYQTRTDPVLSLATHDVSILLDVIDHQHEPQVHAVQHWNYSANQVPDRVCFQGRAGPVSFDIDVSWAWPVRARRTVFVGERGQIVWDQDANEITLTCNTIHNARAITDPAPQKWPYQDSLSPLHHEMLHWIQCVRSRSQPTTGADQAVAVAQVLDQVRQRLI